MGSSGYLTSGSNFDSRVKNAFRIIDIGVPETSRISQCRNVGEGKYCRQREKHM